MTKSKHKKICNIHETPQHLIDNDHIKKGYRVNFNSFCCLLKSLFQWHNETINVWTHLIGAILIILLVIYTSIQIKSHKDSIIENINMFKLESKDGLMSFFDQMKESSLSYYEHFETNLSSFKQTLSNINCSDCIKDIIDHIEEIRSNIVFNVNSNYDIYKNKLLKKLDSESMAFVDLYHKHKEGDHIFIVSRWPLFVFLFGAICCLTFSSVYHLFFLHSQKVWKILAKLDYAGISILISTSCFPPYYYYFYCDQGKSINIINIGYMNFYLYSVSIFSVATFTATFVPGFDQPSKRFLRGFLFSGLVVSALFPFIHLGCFNVIGAVNEYTYTNSIFCILCYLLGVIIYMKRFPENLWPGKFCYIGSSHQLWHVLIVLAVIFTYFSSLDAYNSRLGQSICPLIRY